MPEAKTAKRPADEVFGVIELNSAGYSYRRGTDAVRALWDVTLQIPEGQYVVVLGHNGSGKSTFARLLNGLLTPTEGEVLIDGLSTRSPDQVAEIRRRVGMIFQNPDNQMVATRVEEDVAFGPENLGLPREEIRRRVDDALQRVGMSQYAQHEPHHLSGGQKQRVAIAGVLAMQPRYLVLDEATSMLDRQGVREVAETVEALRLHGVTIVRITHVVDEAIDADRVLVLVDGAVALDGPPRDVLGDVERLRGCRLEAPPMRLLAELLGQSGLPLAGDRRLTVAELVEALCASNL